MKSLHMENFKIFKDCTIDFGNIAKIRAQNYKGKSSIADAFSWVLFGKSATGNSEGKQFVPRRYEVDAEGNQIPIDHVDVAVEINLQVDDRPITIRKVQKQNWVRKRGSEDVTYEGDTNEYFWNEVKVSETDHKRRVAEIVDESIFRMVTSPHAFVNMKQDDQRKFLVEKIAQITDADVLESSGEFPLLRELFKANTLEEIKAVNKKALQGYKEKQTSIPIRIDETSKLIVDLDFAEQELALSALKTQYEEIERKIADTSIAYTEAANLKTEIAEYRSKLNEIASKERDSLSSKRRDVHSKVDNATYALTKAFQNKTTTEADIKSLTELIVTNEIYMEAHKTKFADAKAKEIDPEQNTCPNCHRELPEDMKADVLANFEKVKASEVERLKNEGNAIFLKLKEQKAKLAVLQADLKSAEETITILTAAETAAKAEYAAIPSEPDLEENRDYTDALHTIEALENSLKQTEESLRDTDALKAELIARKDDIQAQMDTVKAELAKKQTIDDARDRVDELREELKQATAQAAECERLDFEIEKFEKAKRNMLSERINGKFRRVKWQLYRQQKNGGIEDVCVCTINGAPYGENTTSTTEKLMAGLDIVQTLQDIYGVAAPIFIDDADLYNSWNIPQMPCQMILLLVDHDETHSPEMRVEVEG